ncbi:MAG: DUF3029 family protein [Dehalococcoidia bacterium]|nr:DUF3029 family protein [Dehalococcoidia bacterium]
MTSAITDKRQEESPSTATTHRQMMEAVAQVDTMTPRVRKRRQEYLDSQSYVCAERSHLATLGFIESEGHPTDIRWAEVYRRILEGVSVAIHDEEMIVGSQTKHIRGGSPSIEYNSQYVLDQLVDSTLLLDSPTTPVTISSEDAECLRQDAERLLGKTPRDLIRNDWGPAFSEWCDAAVKSRITWSWEDPAPTGACADYEKILRCGLRGIIAEAEDLLWRSPSRGASDSDVATAQFLQGSIIVCRAMIRFAKRYADAARSLAAIEPDQLRKSELERIADVCERVPAEPARDFWEALQSTYFILLGIKLQCGWIAESLGRLDQYLYPYYERSIREGELTRQQAGELLACFWMKASALESVPTLDLREWAQSSEFVSVAVGGVTPDGKDATNELSYLILQLVGQIKMPDPNVTVRYHNGVTPDEFLRKAIETNKAVGGGLPQFINDIHVIEHFTDWGVPLEVARCWYVIGCVNPLLPGCWSNHRATGINMAKILELALHDGVDPVSGVRLGPNTGDARKFGSIEDLYQAHLKQLEFILDRLETRANIGWQTRSKHFRWPYVSAVTSGPKFGSDAMVGGFEFNQTHSYVQDRCCVDVGDSLTAIKTVVFDQQKASLAELIDALDRDFEGAEELRQLLLSAPKYGNDDQTADEMVARLSHDQADIITRRTNPFGFPLRSVRQGASGHYWAGKKTGALPNGRKAWLPTYDGSASPMGGMDRKGPTAVLNSALKGLDQRVAVTTFNQKVPLGALRSEAGMNSLAALIKSYMSRGGHHIQFNIFDAATLREAKLHPEKFRDLVVRVAGYSAFFVELSPEVQDEIIQRTEQALPC